MTREMDDGAAYLFVLPWEIDHPGGVNQVVSNLYGEFESDGSYRPHLLIADWSQPGLTFKNEGRFKTSRYRLRSPCDSRNGLKGLLAYLFTAPTRLRTLHRFLKERKIAVVNSHYPTLNCLDFSILKLLGLFKGKIVLSFHGLDIANASKSMGMERRLWKMMLRSSDALVACSKNLAGIVSAFLPEIAQKTHVVHNGINIRKITSEIDRTAEVEALTRNRPFILNVATFENKKGQDILVKAFKKIHDAFPDMLLVLIGRSGETEDHLKHLAGERGISDDVVMVSNLKHQKVAAFLEKASVFVLPSRVEPFGIVVLEAGIFGVPVVASAVGGVPEILEHDVTGYLVPPDDPDQLAEKIIFLLRNPTVRDRLASNLQRHTREHFDWSNSYRRYLKIANEGTYQQP